MGKKSKEWLDLEDELLQARIEATTEYRELINRYGEAYFNGELDEAKRKLIKAAFDKDKDAYEAYHKHLN